MINIEKHVFNSFQVNTYLIYDETRECIIIDPACNGDIENKSLKKILSEQKLTPVMVLNTHGHIDHILGIEFVKDTFNIPSAAHELEQIIMNNAPLMGEMFGFNIVKAPVIDQYISHKGTINFGNSSLIAIHVPGHSPGSLAYYSLEGNFVVCGDALFEGSIGRTDLPGGDYDTLINSIRNNLFTLPKEVTVYPGHGNSSTIENEINHNPFFNDYKT